MIVPVIAFGPLFAAYLIALGFVAYESAMASAPF